MTRGLRMYSATPHIGHGLNGESLKTALEWGADVVVAQGTSTDPGPYYLGAGVSYMQRVAVKKDLATLLTQTKLAGVPFIVSLGGAGATAHLEESLSILDEVCKENRLSLQLAVIDGEMKKEFVKERLRAGASARRIVNTPYLVENLTEDEADRSVRLVAQMGFEPIADAFQRFSDIDGVVTGRALDVGLFAAFPMMRGYESGLGLHFATVMHDGALAAVPGSGSDGMYGVLQEEYFELTPPNPKRICTPLSVAGMSFYERPNPFLEHMPGGFLDVSQATYTQVTDRTVRVQGAVWNPQPYTVKLEGAALAGYRAICMAGIADPILINKVDGVLEEVYAQVEEMFSEHRGEFQVLFRVYGRDAVLGTASRPAAAMPSELGVLIDVMAETQALADAVCSVTRSAVFHHGYPGRTTTAGNLAIPFSPVEVRVGPSYRYNVWHALEIDDPVEPFPSRFVEFPRR